MDEGAEHCTDEGSADEDHSESYDHDGRPHAFPA
jgi:hypothetical protein